MDSGVQPQGLRVSVPQSGDLVRHCVDIGRGVMCEEPALWLGGDPDDRFIQGFLYLDVRGVLQKTYNPEIFIVISKFEEVE